VVLQLGWLGEVLTIPHRKSWPCYETDTFAKEFLVLLDVTSLDANPVSYKGAAQ